MGKKKQAEPLPNIGKEELAVFQFVQENAPVTVRQAADHFASLGKARTTVLTVMERLREKGLLERTKTSGAYQYKTAVESTSLMKSLVGDFVQQFLGGSVAPFVAYMSEASELSEDQIDELKKIVESLEPKKLHSNSRGKSK